MIVNEQNANTLSSQFKPFNEQEWVTDTHINLYNVKYIVLYYTRVMHSNKTHRYISITLGTYNIRNDSKCIPVYHDGTIVGYSVLCHHKTLTFNLTTKVMKCFWD